MAILLSVLTVIAIIAGPILAVQVQKLIERITQKRQSKKTLFMTLMSTRGRPLVLEHVQALNMIDVIFSDKSIFDVFFRDKRKKERAVVDAWSEYRDHLNDYPKQPPSESGNGLSEAARTAYKSKCDDWQSRSIELLAELLAKMAASLNYHFDKVLLKKGAYTPRGYGDTELAQLVIQRGLSEVLLGLKSIPIRVVEVPSTERTESSKEAPSEMPKQPGKNNKSK